jgi:mono/diheme cytochrome c family protein
MNLNLSTAILSFSAMALLAGCGQQGADRKASVKPAVGKPSAAKPVSGSPAFTEFLVPPKPEVTADLLARGKNVYAQNCIACHGVNGDGKGDAAAFLAPKPRDFTKANYRLRTTAPNSLPPTLISSAKFR